MVWTELIKGERLVGRVPYCIVNIYETVFVG